MPELSGREVLQRLISIDPEVAVVVMSGTNRDRDAILAQGAKAFVLKPYRAADMLLALSQALHPGSTPNQAGSHQPLL
jgi:CheY-like chemotaxis protein